MGNSQSNRKITIQEDEVAGVIKISDSLVRRLKGEIDQGKEKRRQTFVPSNDTTSTPDLPKDSIKESHLINPVEPPPTFRIPIHVEVPAAAPFTIDVPVETPTPAIANAPVPVAVDEPVQAIIEVPTSATVVEPVVVDVLAPTVVDTPVSAFVDEPVAAITVEPVLVVDVLAPSSVDVPLPAVADEPVPVIVDEPAYSVDVPLPAVADEPVPAIIEVVAPAIVDETVPAIVDVQAPAMVDEPVPAAMDEPLPTIVDVLVPAVPVEAPTPVVQTPVASQVREPRPYENFMEEAHITALRLKEENGAKIRQVEDHWRNQLLNITDQYDQLKKLNEDEYHAAMTKVNGYYASFEKIEGVCSDRKNCLLKCYQDNKNQSLLCSGEVKQFESCVQQFRLNNIGKST